MNQADFSQLWSKSTVSRMSDGCCQKSDVWLHIEYIEVSSTYIESRRGFWENGIIIQTAKASPENFT